MLETIISLDIIQKILINTLVVSIPEEIYLVMFILIFLGEFEYWREKECKKIFHKYDISRVLIPAIIVALTSNVLRYTITSSVAITLIPIAILYLLIILTNNILKDASALKWMLKAFIILVFGYMTIGISELIYLPFIQYSCELTLEEINSNLFSNFLLSIPAKIIQLSIIILLITSRRTLSKYNIMKYVFSSNVLTLITLTFIFFHLLILWIIHKLIVVDLILINSSSFVQFTIVIFSIIFIFLNILLYISLMYYLKIKNLDSKLHIKESLINLKRKINNYSNSDIIDTNWIFNLINTDITKIINDINSENETRNTNKNRKG